MNFTYSPNLNFKHVFKYVVKFSKILFSPWRRESQKYQEVILNFKGLGQLTHVKNITYW